MALAAGLVVRGTAGYGPLTGAINTHAFACPGCGETWATPADVSIEGAQDVSYPSRDGLTLST